MALMPKLGDKVLETDFENEIIKSMSFLANRYTRAKYGRNFVSWLVSENPPLYKRYGNGSAMGVSPVAWAFDNINEREYQVLQYIIDLCLHRLYDFTINKWQK